MKFFFSFLLKFFSSGGLEKYKEISSFPTRISVVGENENSLNLEYMDKNGKLIMPPPPPAKEHSNENSKYSEEDDENSFQTPFALLEDSMNIPGDSQRQLRTLEIIANLEGYDVSMMNQIIFFYFFIYYQSVNFPFLQLETSHEQYQKIHKRWRT